MDFKNQTYPYAAYKRLTSDVSKVYFIHRLKVKRWERYSMKMEIRRNRLIRPNRLSNKDKGIIT